MQTLGLSDSTPRTETPLKSFFTNLFNSFWPSIKNASDADDIGVRGYWLCTSVAVLGFNMWIILGIFLGSTLVGIVGLVWLLFFYLSAVGMRERSLYAATIVVIICLTATHDKIGMLFPALFLPNLIAAWIASRRIAQSGDAILPAQRGETWGEKLSDKLPAWLWPRVRIFYYVFSAGLLALVAVHWWMRLHRVAWFVNSIRR